MAGVRNWRMLAEELAKETVALYSYVMARENHRKLRLVGRWIDDKMVVHRKLKFRETIDVFDETRYLYMYAEYDGKHIVVYSRPKVMKPFFLSRVNSLYAKKRFFKIVEKDDWESFFIGDKETYRAKKEIHALPEFKEKTRGKKGEVEDWFIRELVKRVSKRKIIKFMGFKKETVDKALAEDGE